MSFILDALKKSETERQQQSTAQFSSVPSGPPNSSSARWLWLLSAVLFINIAVLVAVLVNIDGDSADESEDDSAALVRDLAAPPQASKLPAIDSQASSFEEQVATAVRELPPATPQSAAPSRAQSDMQRSNDSAAPVTRPATRASTVPTIDQLRLDGSLVVDELHVDIHVYSENPGERFVFINMDKHREGSRIDEGPVVKEITPDGVILDYQGKTFLLPRE